LGKRDKKKKKKTPRMFNLVEGRMKLPGRERKIERAKKKGRGGKKKGGETP